MGLLQPWKWPLLVLAVGLLTVGSGCARSRPHAKLGDIYSAVAQAPDFSRNPIIVIPGILGSRLVEDDTGRVVWGKFDIAAHSMGGLIARYYLRYGAHPLPDNGSLPPLDWAGAQNLARVVLVGTPNAGSALAIRDLVRGYRLAPILPGHAATVLGTMPAVYQLLPRSRHGAPAAARDLWRVSRPARPCLHLIQPQLLSNHWGPSHVDVQSGKIQMAQHTVGDDTTTRASAVMDERTGGSRAVRLVSPIHWTSVMFLHSSHRGLTSDPIFTDNVLALLLESPQLPLVPTAPQPPSRMIKELRSMPSSTADGVQSGSMAR